MLEQITLENVLMLVGLIVLIAIAAGGIFTVDTGTRKIVQRFGKFRFVAQPGLNFKMPMIDQIAWAGTPDEDGDREMPMDMRVQQLDLKVDTKTKDNSFVAIHLAVQFQVQDPEKAFYRLDDPEEQISAYVFDVVRSQVPGMTIDETFEKKNDLAHAVKLELQGDMAEFGYQIIGVLVTDVEPDAKIKNAMNDIVASQREQIAATARGEAQKIMQIKAAEAEAESKKLQGEGIAGQRKAIVAGLEESVKSFQEGTGVQAEDVMQMVLLTQYFDTLKEIGASGNTSTIFLPHGPGALQDLLAQLQGSIQTALKGAKA